LRQPLQPGQAAILEAHLHDRHGRASATSHAGSDHAGSGRSRMRTRSPLLGRFSRTWFREAGFDDGEVERALVLARSKAGPQQRMAGYAERPAGRFEITTRRQAHRPNCNKKNVRTGVQLISSRSNAGNMRSRKRALVARVEHPMAAACLDTSRAVLIPSPFFRTTAPARRKHSRESRAARAAP
jgi:hypothetical protein